jgi:uncharacterized membrane protein YfcA
MTDIENPGNAAPDDNPETTSWKLELWLFLLMLVLAIAGVGVTQTDATGGPLYWVFLLVVYAIISLALGWRRQAKMDRSERSVWRTLRCQVFHWLGAFIAIDIVLYFESVDIASRGAAADYALIVLSLSCYLAGVHLNWIFLPLSVILAVMAVGLGYLDQLSLYTLLVPLGILAAWIFIWIRLRARAKAKA